MHRQATVKAALAPLSATHTLYTSSDPELYKRLKIANPPPTSSLLVFASHEPYPAGSLAFPADQQAVERFINVHRFPTLVQLTTSNFNDILKSPTKAVVVLGALHSTVEGEKEKAKLYNIARAWKRGGRTFSQPVRFAWVDSDKWAGWLKQSFDIKRNDLPAAVVIDTSVSASCPL